MKLDDRGRRAAAEVKEASSRAHFSVRAPGSRRPLLARPAVAVGAAAVVLAVGLPLLFVLRPWGQEVLEPGPTTTTTTQTTTTTTTTIPGSSKRPATDVDELVERLYAALNAMDDEAFRALSADGAQHAVYVTDGTTGSITSSFSHDSYRLASAGYLSIEVLGEPIVSGYVVAVPVAYTYPEAAGVLTGFDLAVLAPTGSGWLLGGGVGFLADPGLEADLAEAEASIEASAAAFNADDVDGVLATYAEYGVLWEDVTDAGSTYTGAALRQFLSNNRYFTVEFTAEPAASGPFVVVPSHHTAEATANGFDGMYVFWIRDGEIALQAYAQGA